jgi:hypothetical protein
MGKHNLNRLFMMSLVFSLLFFSSVGNALAAEDDDGDWSILNIRDGVDKFVDKLDPKFQGPANWLIDNVFVLVVVGTVLLIWLHGLEDASAKRSGSISGQAQAQKNQDNTAKKFIWSIVLTALVILFATKSLL